jgi:hypothetical protein
MLRTISLRLGRVNRNLGYHSHQYVPVVRYTGAPEGLFRKDIRAYGGGSGSGRPNQRREPPPPRPSGFGLKRPGNEQQSWASGPSGQPPRNDQAATPTEQQSRPFSPRSQRGVFWDPSNFGREGRRIRNGDGMWQYPKSSSSPPNPPPSGPSRLVSSRDAVEVVDAETYSQLANAAGPSTSSISSNTIIPASPQGHEVIADLDEFFAGHADAVITAPTTTDLPQPVQRRESPPVPSSGLKALATYTPPRESGVEMVKRLMLEHKFLTTQEIFKLGTDGHKPLMQPDHVIEPNGRIRMKRVATMREGRRPWVPPAAPAFPEHPFRSVR